MLYFMATWYEKIVDALHLDRVYDNITTMLANLSGKYLEGDITDRERAELDYQGQWQSRLADEAYERNIDFYERYQSPGAVMGQYKAAGINPALMYGNYSGPSASNMSSAGSVSAPSGGADVLGSLLSFASKKYSIDKEMQNAARDRIIDERRIDVDRKKNELEERRIHALENLYNRQGNVYDANAEYLRTQKEALEFLYPRQAQQLETNIKVMEDSLKTAEVQRELMKKDIDLKEAQRVVEVYKAGLLQVQKKHAEKYYSLTNDILEAQKEIAKWQGISMTADAAVSLGTAYTRISSAQKQLQVLTLQEGLLAKEGKWYDANQIKDMARTAGYVLNTLGNTYANFATRGVSNQPVKYPVYNMDSTALGVTYDAGYYE